jgi:hypothetical protein
MFKPLRRVPMSLAHSLILPMHEPIHLSAMNKKTKHGHASFYRSAPLNDRAVTLSSIDAPATYVFFPRILPSKRTSGTKAQSNTSLLLGM